MGPGDPIPPDEQERALGALRWPESKVTTTPEPAVFRDAGDGTRFLPVRRGQHMVNPKRQMKKKLMREAAAIYGRPLTKREKQRLARRLRTQLEKQDGDDVV